MLTFDELGLSPRVLQAVNEMGFEETTPIQQQAIPIALQGRDLIGQAQTGTGKTAAFGIPMVERFDVDKEYIQGIVVTPTRELAIQWLRNCIKSDNLKGSPLSRYMADRILSARSRPCGKDRIL